MSFPTISRRTTTAACAGIGAAALLAVAAPAQAATEVEWPEEFTSAFHAVATPENVVDSEGEPAPGEEGATGDFMLWANADMNVICYEITLEGVTGEYESPAVTATHIHDADAGEPGPPVVAFADPEPEGETTRMSSGCLQGPFETGVEDDDGNDAGMSFTVEDLEADPAGFSVDTHTADFVPGAVRAQLAQVPLDGMETGGGGTAVASGPEAMASTGPGSSVAAPAAGAGALALLGAGALLYFRRARGAKA